MQTVVKQTTISANSMLVTGFNTIDYQDLYQIYKETEQSVENIAKEIMKLPAWAAILFKIRNFIVQFFGLKTENEQQSSFFPLIAKNEAEIVTGLSDKHLDFRISVMKNQEESTVSLATIVHFNNIFGKIYFFPVKPFHKIIVKSLLTRYANENINQKTEK